MKKYKRLGQFLLLFCISTPTFAVPIINVLSASSQTYAEMAINLGSGGSVVLSDAETTTDLTSAAATTGANLCSQGAVGGQCAGGASFEGAGINSQVRMGRGADTTIKAWYTGSHEGALSDHAGTFDYARGLATTQWTFSVAGESTSLSSWIWNTYAFVDHYLYLYDLTAGSALLEASVTGGAYSCGTPPCRDEIGLELDHFYTIIATTEYAFDRLGDYDNEPYTGFSFASDAVLVMNVPEPSAYALMGLGLLGLVSVRKRTTFAINRGSDC